MKHLVGTIRGIIAVTAVVLLASVHQSGSAQTPTEVSSCGTYSGSLIQMQDLAYSSEHCITLLSNSTYNGNGHTITVSGTGDYAFWIYNQSNVSMTDVSTNAGISILTDNNSNTVAHVSLTQSTTGPITVHSVDDVTIDHVTMPSVNVYGEHTDPVLRTVFTHNTVSGNAHTLVHFLGGDDHSPCPTTDFVVTDNVVTSSYQCGGSGQDVCDEPKVFFMYCAKHNTVARNTFHALGQAMAGRFRDNFDDSTVSDNVFWSHAPQYPFGAVTINTGSVDTTSPANNTFSHNIFRTDIGPEIYFSVLNTGNRFEHNVFWGDGGTVNGGYGQVFDHNTFYNTGTGNPVFTLDYRTEPADTWTNNIFDYSGSSVFAYDGFTFARYAGNNNLFHNRSGSVSFGSTYPSLNAWKSAASPDDSASLAVDPLFTNPGAGDFTLQAASLARGAGTDGSDIGASVTSTTAPPTTTPSFNIVPTTLDFYATQSGADPAQQGVAVFGVNGQLQWEVSTPVNWITFSATSGSTPTAVMVRVSNTLPVGTYSAKINFTATNYSGVTGSVNVNFTVTATDVLSVSKTVYNFKAVQGHAAQDQYLTVQSGAAAGWTGTVNTGSAPAWLSITPTSGTVYNDPANPVHIQVNAANLGIASYTGTITVASAGAVPSSVVITVNLSVTPPPIMDTSPRPLNVSVTEGKTARPMLEISNRGASETELDWSINQPTEPWIKLSITGDCGGPFPSPISGFAAGGRTSMVTVCITTVPAGSPQLVPGTYTTTLTVLAPGADLLGGAATDVVPVNLAVTTDSTPPTVAAGSIFFGHFDTGTTPVTQYAVPPSASCTTTPPTFSVEISWTSDEFGDTRLKWGEQLDADGHPLYERGTILKPEILDTGAHTGGTLYHTVSLSNMNYVYGGHTYYYAIASQDRYGNPVDWNASGVWTDHDQNNSALYLNFKIGSACDESAPTNVHLQLPTTASTLFGTITIIMSAQDESLITRFELLKKNETGPDTVLQNFPVSPASCSSTGDSYSCLMTALFDTRLIQPDGTWFLVARAYDAVGLAGLSSEVAISVSNATPEVSGVTATPTDLGGGQWQTVITWDTDYPSDSSVQYGMEDDDGTFKGYTYVQSGDDTGRTDLTTRSAANPGHTVTLSGLLAGRVYHYMITSCPTGVSDPERCGH